MSQMNLIYTWQPFSLDTNVKRVVFIFFCTAITFWRHLLVLVSSVQTFIEKLLRLLLIIQNERLGENWGKRSFVTVVVYFIIFPLMWLAHTPVLHFIWQSNNTLNKTVSFYLFIYLFIHFAEEHSRQLGNMNHLLYYINRSLRSCVTKFIKIQSVGPATN